MTASQQFFADLALLPAGWSRNVRIGVDGGNIAAIASDATAGGAMRLSGALVPGMPNAHSHAFQRALAGRLESALVGPQTFWSWRDGVYALIKRLEPDDVESIAAYLYAEMLEGGYTSVAEFHYLHNAPDGKPYANRGEMSQRVLRAAQRTGIGITLLLALYRHSDFSAHDVLPEQRRFVMSVDELVGTLGTLGAEFKEARIGVAPHSLRAVNAQDLKELLASIPPETTVHMHIAEQRREVEASLRHYNERPVTWLLANAPVSSAWTLVHATHATQAELQGIAKSGAVVALAPTTEANLGDGIFSASEFHDAGGRFAIGSDSHVAIDPFAELRMLEYAQRLREAQRGILKRHYRQALQGGAQSLGIRAGSLEVGRRADFITLDLDDPALSGWPEQALLDAWIFGPARNPVRDVVAAGVQVVSGGRHRDREALAEAYKKTLRRLFS